MRLWLGVAAVIGLLTLAAWLTVRATEPKPIIAEGSKLAWHVQPSSDGAVQWNESASVSELLEVDAAKPAPTLRRPPPCT